jgi:hypothetical protein
MESTELITVFNLNEFILRASIDIITMIILVGIIYYPKYKNKDFIFTFSIFNVINFLICILLGSAKIKVGFAFGLFAIFSIIRYRTILISIKDMGYFFVCVALGMLNSLAVVDENPLVLISCNLFVLLMIFLLEKLDFLDNENSKDIVYDNVNLIKPENRDELIADLKERTGLEIHKVVVLSINYLKDTALIKAYYFSKISENNVSSFEDKDND